MNTNYLAFQILNFALLILWLILVILALFRLRSTNLSDGLRLGWSIIILLLPVIGSLAFFIVVPKNK
jgi:hypothetical protein